ncbi:MAG: extracellular solute-binding protein [Actinobacteria bacterium]|nr:extracellular solute-binding protein [Actinomycetota bacterium]
MLLPLNLKMARGSTRGRRAVGGGAATLALVTSAALLAACGSSPSSSSSSGGTLKIITWVNPPAVAAIKKIDAEFEKANPGVKVSLGTAENVNGPYKTMLQSTVSSTSADIVTNVTQAQPMPPKPTTSNMTAWQNWTSHGVFAPLNGQPWLKDYTPAARQAETVNGKTYGVVSGEYQEGVFYNKKTFAKYGLAPPKTYSQFLKVLDTLKSKGVTPMYVGLGAVGPVYLQFIYYELMASVWQPHVPGQTLGKDLETGVVKWTDPHFTQVMNEEKKLAQYLEPGYTGEPWQGMPGAFANGKAAMLLDGSWDLASVQKANPSMQVGFFPLPGSNNPADNQSEIQNDLTFSVLNGSPHKALAMKWLAFFSQPKIYSQYVDITGISSSQVSGKFNSYAAKVLGPWFGKGANDGVFFPILADTNKYWDQPANWPTLQQDMINGKKTPAQVEQLYQSDWQTS